MKNLLLVLLVAGAASAQELNPDPVVAEVMKRTQAPSVSIAVVRPDQPVFLKAYGTTVETPFAIGSVSKQFTAAAVLRLVEQGKLSLDDRVARWFPELTRAQDVTVRQLLSMTAGYRDYWPQDYVMPGMLASTTPLAIVSEWARLPLDFDPGTRWQYSNTNYVLAGLIAEKVSGKPLLEQLQTDFFAPLGMGSARLADKAGYRRFAMGPARKAPETGANWLFGAGELQMTPADLARWNGAMLQQKALAPSSYAALQRDTLLANGQGTRYGLGVVVTQTRGRRLITHGGEVSGYTATNHVLPDDGLAVTVVADLDATDATAAIADRLLEQLLAAPGADERVRRLLARLREGQVDASLLTANCQAYFSAEARGDYRKSLLSLGELKEVAALGETSRGGMVNRNYRLVGSAGKARLSTYVTADGKFEQFLILPD